MTKRDDAPQRVTPPTITTIRSEVPRTAALPQDQPALGRYFDEILGVLESAIRALERTPGRYHEWDEESLRDALLIPLNSQFQGAGQAEAFNAGGKADLLIRAGDQNLFIGECKIWDGPSRFNDRRPTAQLQHMARQPTRADRVRQEQGRCPDRRQGAMCHREPS